MKALNAQELLEFKAFKHTFPKPFPRCLSKRICPELRKAWLAYIWDYSFQWLMLHEGKMLQKSNKKHQTFFSRYLILSFFTFLNKLCVAQKKHIIKATLVQDEGNRKVFKDFWSTISGGGTWISGGDRDLDRAQFDVVCNSCFSISIQYN